MKRTWILAAAAAVTVGSSLVSAPSASAASNTVVGHCAGTAVRRCVEVRRASDIDYRAWAKITDIQTDNIDNSVKIVRVQLQKYSYGTWETGVSKAGDGKWYLEWDAVQTKTTAWGTESGKCKLRAKATFKIWNHRTGGTSTSVVYSGAKTVACADTSL